MDLQSTSLALTGLPAEFTRLRSGGIYWVACATIEHADVIGAGLLEATQDSARTVVVGMGRSPAPLLERVPEDRGPNQVRLYQVSGIALEAAFRFLHRDLARAAKGHRALCVVQLPAVFLDRLDESVFARSCQQLNQWALTTGSTLLLLCHGDAATLAPRLLPLNRFCAGVAQLYPHLGALQYIVHYWANTHGVVAHREFRLELQDGRLHEVPMQNPVEQALMLQEAGDRFMYLAQAAVLEGAPPFSPAWRVFESWSTLVASALQAQAASVLFAVTENGQVEELARTLHRLRRERGNALKLVVREMVPCLRYADERLLLECGTNLVVPPSTPLPRFLSLLETIQGQRWQGELAGDPVRLIRAHRPPDIGGIVPAMQFRQIVGALLAAEHSQVENALLVLQPVAGLRAEQALRQCTIRRRGDLACAYRGQVRLFLFACRSDGIERALDNLFRLPWREMFAGYQDLAEYDVSAMNASELTPDTEVIAAEPVPAMPGPAPIVAGPLQPRAVRLVDGP